ncbi:MAG: S8 family peptidase [Cellulosilyticaceae bacterium]
MANETKTYMVEDRIDLNQIKEKFPRFDFWQIAPGIIAVQVPNDAQAELVAFETQVDIVGIPTLYGLNVDTGFEDSNINFFHNYPFGELRGNGVLIGFVDTGIDYTNPLFQYEDGTTRIKAIWDQTVAGSTSQLIKYGDVYTEEQINEALKSSDPHSIVPEKDEVGHGTFLAGVAAGYDRSGNNTYEGGAPDAGLVIVKLRPAQQYLRDYYLIENNVYACQDNDVLAGMTFLMDEARRQGMPMVICIGVGGNWGAHNGSAIVERFIQTTTVYNDLIIVSSAGNEANKAHHYENQIKEGEMQELEVNIGEDESGMIIQLWASPIDKLAVGLSSPLGYQIEKVPVANNIPVSFNPPLENTKITITYRWPDIATGAERIEIRLENPTPGIWTIRVYGELIVNGSYNLWLPREGFIRPNTRFNKPEAYTTVCIPATSANGLVVGAYNSKDKSLYVASGRGPTTNGVIKPDLIAPGVDVVGPSRDGGYTTYTGTSVAAAITSAACVLLMEWAVVKGNMPKMNTRVATTMLIRGAQRQKGTAYPNNIEGYGRLDLKNTISLG